MKAKKIILIIAAVILTAALAVGGHFAYKYFSAKNAKTTDAPVTETPATETPSTETPVTETPVTETPATETSSTETPSTETPSTETPSTETPVTETPATETPVETETPADPDFELVPTGKTTVTLGDEDLHKGSLVLAKADAPFNPEWAEDLVTVLSVRVKLGYGPSLKGGELKLNTAAAGAVCALHRAMQKNFGTDRALLINTDAYLKEDAKGDHLTGYAVNLDFWNNGAGTWNGFGDFACRAEAQWIRENAAKYGFVLRYEKTKSELTGQEEEANHFRYVGIAHAAYMYDNRLCLEEYLELLKVYTPDERLIVTDKNGNDWSVYYVAAAEGGTEIPLPDGVVYEISGNNKDGFIVAVKSVWVGSIDLLSSEAD